MLLPGHSHPSVGLCAATRPQSPFSCTLTLLLPGQSPFSWTLCCYQPSLPSVGFCAATWPGTFQLDSVLLPGQSPFTWTLFCYQANHPSLGLCATRPVTLQLHSDSATTRPVTLQLHSDSGYYQATVTLQLDSVLQGQSPFSCTLCCYQATVTLQLDSVLLPGQSPFTWTLCCYQASHPSVALCAATRPVTLQLHSVPPGQSSFSCTLTLLLPGQSPFSCTLTLLLPGHNHPSVAL